MFNKQETSMKQKLKKTIDEKLKKA